MFKSLTISLTRKCPWKCHYCNFTDQKSKEMKGKEWIDFLTEVKMRNQDTFISIMGGEPLVYQDIEYFIEGINELGLPYTVTTTGPSKKKNIIKKIKGISISVDLVVPEDVKVDKRKSCLKLLREVCDGEYGDPSEKIFGIVGETMMSHYSLEKTLEEAQNLINEIEYWICDPIYMEPKWNEHYDLAADFDRDKFLLNKDDMDLIIDFMQKNRNRILFPYSNISFAELIRDTLPDIPRHCDVRYAVSIDPDGQFRLCYRIKGTLDLHINDFLEDYDKAYNKLLTDLVFYKRTLCQGCWWQCPYFTLLEGSNQGYPQGLKE